MLVFPLTSTTFLMVLPLLVLVRWTEMHSHSMALMAFGKVLSPQYFRQKAHSRPTRCIQRGATPAALTAVTTPRSRCELKWLAHQERVARRPQLSVAGNVRTVDEEAIRAFPK